MKKNTLILIISLCFFSNSYATSLKEEIAKLLETNPIVLERLSNYKQSTQDLKIANARNLPTLDLHSSIGYEATDTNNFTFANRTSLAYYETSLVFMQNIFDGYATMHEIDYQKARILASSYNFVQKSNQLAFEMTYAYINLLKQKELLEVAKENVLINADILSKVQALYQSGLTKRSEMQKIESSLSLSKSNLVVQQNNLLDASFQYHKLLGNKPNLKLIKKPTLTTALPKSLQSALDYTLSKNPALQVVAYNIKAAKSLYKQNDSSMYPKIDFKISQDLDKNVNGIQNDRNNFRAGLILSYNLYKGGVDEANTQKHISKINQEIYVKRDLKRQLTEDINLSWGANVMLYKQLKELYVYKDFSESTLSLYQEEYNLGRRSLLDLLSTQNDLINAKSQIIKTTYDFLFSKYRVLNAMGIMVPSILGKEYTYASKVGLDENSIAYVDEKLLEEKPSSSTPLKNSPLKKCKEGSLEDVLLDTCKPKQMHEPIEKRIPKPKPSIKKKIYVQKAPPSPVITETQKIEKLFKSVQKKQITTSQHSYVVGNYRYLQGAQKTAKLFSSYDTQIKTKGSYHKVYVYTDASNDFRDDLKAIRKIVPDAWYARTIKRNATIDSSKAVVVTKPALKVISKPIKTVPTKKPKVAKAAPKAPTKFHRFMVGSFENLQEAQAYVKKFSGYKSKVVNMTYYYEVYLYTTTSKHYTVELSKLSSVNQDTWYNGIYAYKQ
ncbi:MAG: TolC family protein [Campylobacterota bacterium]|nr:TolC family protein [Campylobacterota bacterium]